MLVEAPSHPSTPSSHHLFSGVSSCYSVYREKTSNFTLGVLPQFYIKTSTPYLLKLASIDTEEMLIDCSCYRAIIMTVNGLCLAFILRTSGVACDVHILDS